MANGSVTNSIALENFMQMRYNFHDLEDIGIKCKIGHLSFNQYVRKIPGRKCQTFYRYNRHTLHVTSLMLIPHVMDAFSRVGFLNFALERLLCSHKMRHESAKLVMYVA